ncbi:MAG: MMPL family transporter [Flavobacteriales bacterium]|nr:MMPL family transporter [Flavobacteriales bacterium]
MISKDERSLLLILQKEEETSKTENDKLLVDIERLIEQQGVSNYELAGRIKTQNYYVEAMGAELSKLSLISLVLIIVFLYVLYRCWATILIPIITLLISVVWSFGFLQLTGGKLDLVLTVLPTLLFVIGISNTIHLLSVYTSKRKIGLGKHEAIEQTFREIGLATFLTSLTTAIGFYALLLIEINPIKNFGLYAGSGILISYLISIIVVPSILLNMNDAKLCRVRGENQFRNKLFNRLFRIRTNSYNKVLTASLIIFISAVLFIPKIKVNNHFLDDLNSSSSLKHSLLFFEDQFSGIRPFELGIESREGPLFTIKKLKEVQKVEQYIVENYEVEMLLSPLVVIKTANKATHGGTPEKYDMPSNEKELKQNLQFIRSSLKSGKLDHLISEDLKRARITGKIHDLGSARLKVINTEFEEWLKESKLSIEVQLTGGAYLMDKTNQSIAFQLVKGLAFAFFIVWLILLLMFRSVKVATLSMIPNVLPMIMIMGIMGFIGVDLKVGTALIFTIAFGISVDDTIHLLSHYRQKLKEGLSSQKALEESLQVTGKAILFTSSILSAGFLTLIFSSFKSTSLMGIFVSLTLFFALIFDVVLLPSLLLKFSSKK